MSTNCKCGQPITHRVLADTADGQKQIRVCQGHLRDAAELAIRKLNQGVYLNYTIEEL